LSLKKSYVYFLIFIDEEIATIYLNDSLYCDREVFKLDQSLGILTNTAIKTNAEKIKLRMTFEGFPY
jgi:hypothetical protein